MAASGAVTQPGWVPDQKASTSECASKAKIDLSTVSLAAAGVTTGDTVGDLSGALWRGFLAKFAAHDNIHGDITPYSLCVKGIHAGLYSGERGRAKMACTKSCLWARVQAVKGSRYRCGRVLVMGCTTFVFILAKTFLVSEASISFVRISCTSGPLTTL